MALSRHVEGTQTSARNSRIAIDNLLAYNPMEPRLLNTKDSIMQPFDSVPAVAVISIILLLAFCVLVMFGGIYPSLHRHHELSSDKSDVPIRRKRNLRRAKTFFNLQVNDPVLGSRARAGSRALETAEDARAVLQSPPQRATCDWDSRSRMIEDKTQELENRILALTDAMQCVDSQQYRALENMNDSGRLATRPDDTAALAIIQDSLSVVDSLSDECTSLSYDVSRHLVGLR